MPAGDSRADGAYQARLWVAGRKEPFELAVDWSLAKEKGMEASFEGFHAIAGSEQGVPVAGGGLFKLLRGEVLALQAVPAAAG